MAEVEGDRSRSDGDAPATANAATTAGAPAASEVASEPASDPASGPAEAAEAVVEPAAASDGGVVDPIRIPAWLREPVEEAWREAPPVVRLFVILALVDIVSRGVGILQPRAPIGLDLVSAWSFLVPHDLWILLPAVLVLRRPDSRSATPLVFWGAVVVALVQVLASPLESWVLVASPSLSPLSVDVSILAAAASAVGWVLIARGLAALGPARPDPTLAGLANLGLVAELVVALYDFASAAASAAGNGGFGDVGVDGLIALQLLVAFVGQVAWAYLLWIVIRGFGDLRRPVWGTSIGALGAGLVIVFDVVGGFLGAVVGAAQSPIHLGGGLAVADFAYAVGLLRYFLAEVLLVIAFGLGLAEPPLPYVPGTPSPDGEEPALGLEPSRESS